MIIQNKFFNAYNLFLFFFFTITKKSLANVFATSSGNINVASANIFTAVASFFILPQDFASSGLAPESLPSNSWPVFK